jgi:hypothetical protein
MERPAFIYASSVTRRDRTWTGRRSWRRLLRGRPRRSARYAPTRSAPTSTDRLR